MKILFRGKSINNGEWFYGDLVKKGQRRFIVANVEIENDYGDGIDLFFYATDWAEVEPKTVGRYTGLKDINGKQIFEGDIVKNTNTSRSVYPIGQEMIGFIIFNEHTQSYISKNNFQKYGDWCFAEDKEIIGNIYDN